MIEIRKNVSGHRVTRNDFYPGEIRDMVLETLSEVLGTMEKLTRRRDVLEDSFWSHGDQKRRRFAMKSPCGRWHASVYRKQSGGLFSVKRRSATNYNSMVHTQADLCHWPVPNSECLARE